MASWLLTIFLPLTLISSSRVSAEIVADVNEIELTSFLINLRLDESEKDSTIGGIGDIKCQDFTDDIQCPTDLNLTEIISDTGDSASVVVGNLEPGKAYDIQFLEVQLNSGNHSWTRNVTVRQCTGKCYYQTLHRNLPFRMISNVLRGGGGVGGQVREIM